MSDNNVTNINEVKAKSDNSVVKLSEEDLNTLASIDLSIQSELNALGALTHRYDVEKAKKEQAIISFRENHQKILKKMAKKYKIKGAYTLSYQKKALIKLPEFKR